MRMMQVIKKEILEIIHDKTMLAVLVAFPIFVMLFLGSSFGAVEIKGLPIGLVSPENSSFADTLLAGLDESKAFNLRSFDSEENAMMEFRNGKLRAVIVIPEGFDQMLERGDGADISIVVDNSDIALEQSILAAMSSVVEASSTDITKEYVTSAWEELGGLNRSAAVLAADINESKQTMENTKKKIAEIKNASEELNITSLEGSLNKAAEETEALQEQIGSQKAYLTNISANNEILLNQTELFLYNGSTALNESIDAVEGTHARLSEQKEALNETLVTLETTISGLELIQSTVSDNVTATALALNIAGLNALKNSTKTQWEDAEEQLTELEELNATLREFRTSLEEYQTQLAVAKENQAKAAVMQSALEELSENVAEMNASFSEARIQVGKLRTLLSSVEETTNEMDKTLDQAISQADRVDALIAALQSTVAKQTAKDPEKVASPLSVSVENQYKRVSYVDFIMPQVIGVSLLFTCFLLASISIVREKSRRTIIRILMIPGAMLNLVIGKIISLVVLSFGQIALIILVAVVIFNVTIPNDILLLFWATTISSLVLVSIGILIGFVARSESAAIQSSLLLAIPMLFLGNIIFSPDLLPNYTQALQELLPLAHITNLYKIVLITSGDPTADILSLLAYFIVLAAIVAGVIYKRKEIGNYA